MRKGQFIKKYIIPCVTFLNDLRRYHFAKNLKPSKLIIINSYGVILVALFKFIRFDMDEN